MSWSRIVGETQARVPSALLVERGVRPRAPDEFALGGSVESAEPSRRARANSLPSSPRPCCPRIQFLATHRKAHGNSLTGTIPAELSTLTSVYVIEFYSNSLTGTFPSELSTMTRMLNLCVRRHAAAPLGPTPRCLRVVAQVVWRKFADGDYPSRAEHDDALIWG